MAIDIKNEFIQALKTQACSKINFILYNQRLYFLNTLIFQYYVEKVVILLVSVYYYYNIFSFACSRNDFIIFQNIKNCIPTQINRKVHSLNKVFQEKTAAEIASVRKFFCHHYQKTSCSVERTTGKTKF